jgi:hypothetical protein
LAATTYAGLLSDWQFNITNLQRVRLCANANLQLLGSVKSAEVEATRRNGFGVFI